MTVSEAQTAEQTGGGSQQRRPRPVVSVRALHIGWALEWARKGRGMTRAEVAQKIGCHKSWMSRLENGENSPAWDFVEKLAKLYGSHIETIRCGVLPVRLKNLRAQVRTIRRLENRCKKIPGGLEQLQLAEAGVRLPNDLVLRQISAVCGVDDLRELLYGSLA